MMRVLMIVRPASGGMKAHVRTLITGFSRRGMAISLASPDRGLLAEAEALGCTCCHLEIGDWPGPGDFAALGAIRRAVSRWQPDLLHLHGLRAAWLARPLAKWLGLPAIVTYHATLDGGGRFKHAAIAVERRMCRWNAASIAVSEHVRANLLTELGLSQETVVTILNGIDLSSFISAGSEGQLQSSFARPADAVVVGSIARLAEQKDIPTMLRAARIVLKAEPAACFVLGGDGPQRRELEQMAADLGLGARFRFLGWLTEVPAFLSAIDIFLLTSKYEGAPLAAIEAMAAGRPIVSTAVGGLQEIVPTGVAGLIAPVGDASALAGALLELIRRRDLRSGMGAAARDWALAHLDGERMVAATCRLYETALLGRQPDLAAPAAPG